MARRLFTLVGVFCSPGPPSCPNTGRAGQVTSTVMQAALAPQPAGWPRTTISGRSSPGRLPSPARGSAGQPAGGRRSRPGWPAACSSTRNRAADPVAIAMAFAVLLVPYSTLGPFVGVFLDRWSRRQVLFVANCAARRARPAGRLPGLARSERCGLRPGRAADHRAQPVLPGRAVGRATARRRRRAAGHRQLVRDDGRQRAVCPRPRQRRRGLPPRSGRTTTSTRSWRRPRPPGTGCRRS